MNQLSINNCSCDYISNMATQAFSYGTYSTLATGTLSAGIQYILDRNDPNRLANKEVLSLVVVMSFLSGTLGSIFGAFIGFAEAWACQDQTASMQLQEHDFRVLN